MQENNRMDAGLLVLRLGLGVIFIIHGYPKIAGGPAFWTPVGEAMGVFGITFAPAFWGFMAAFSEFAGGICLMLGLFFRLFCALMAITMFVAVSMHVSQDAAFSVFAHPLTILIVMISLLITGAGRYSVAKKANIPLLR